MPPPVRSLLKIIWNDFLKSLRVTPDRFIGEFRGEDHLGNKYYEIGPDPRGGRSRPSRWYESPTEDFLQELPVEWMAWLRRQRSEPPTKEEILRNIEAAKKRAQHSKIYTETQKEKAESSKPSFGTNSRFRKFDEYERSPGEQS